MEPLISLVIWIIVVGLILGLLIWAIDQLPFIPQPFKTVARVLLIVLAVLLLVMKLLPIANISI